MRRKEGKASLYISNKAFNPTQPNQEVENYQAKDKASRRTTTTRLSTASRHVNTTKKERRKNTKKKKIRKTVIKHILNSFMKYSHSANDIVRAHRIVVFDRVLFG